MAGKVRILVVEDSPTVSAFLVDAFNRAPAMEVVAAVADGRAAVEAVRELRPDVVTMDVNMPRMDGLQATRTIMQECPVPIVIVSSVLGDRTSASFKALEAGALAFVRTPVGRHDPMHESMLFDLLQTVRLMSEVKVVRRSERIGAGGRPRSGAAVMAPDRSRDMELVAIGASTGGPPAVRTILAALPPSLAVPVLVVQHMAVGFVEGFATWLSSETNHAVHVGGDGETARPGHVYIAPDGHHMGVDGLRTIRLATTPLEHGLRPAVSFLFRSLLETHGGRAAAVLLSGMGKDGARELLDLRKAGCATFAQDRDSALIFGMPGEAIRLGAASYVMSPPEIGAALSAAVGTSAPRAATGEHGSKML